MMSDLAAKVEAAKDLIARCIGDARAPITMSSFGKDSMVMLDLVRSVDKSLPVLFHREPFLPEKYKFANAVIEKWGLTVYDYHPSMTAVTKANGCIEVIGAYQIGHSHYMELPTGIDDTVKPILCGMRDIYNKPTGSFAFPWDYVFLGHKSSDVDPLRGPVPLKLDVFQNQGAPSYVFPIRHFTDADIWEYAETRSLQIHTDRYDNGNGYAERSDKSKNPDYFPACVACMDADGPDIVMCHVLGAEIENKSATLRRTVPKIYRYIGTPAKAV